MIYVYFYAKLPFLMKKISSLILICLSASLYANKISDGYKALSIFDYFKAKQLFQKSLCKYPLESSYGLATIYSRTDNPFSNTDSAAKYITISRATFKDTLTLSSYHIDIDAVSKLEYTISQKGIEKYSALHSVNAYHLFLTQYPFATNSLKTRCYNLRDSIVYSNYSFYESSDSINSFLLRYPQTQLYTKATADFYDMQYREQVPVAEANYLKLFLIKYPHNPHKIDAEKDLFNITKQLHQPDSLYQFIEKYSTVQFKEQAWKALYSLSVKNYTKDELSRFINKYPNYPYNESVLKEISLAQKLLIPIKNNDDKFGYIDTAGVWAIKPEFDDANLFTEGFASVCKNDSCYYINKDGQKTSDYYFEETDNYNNGAAIVKKGNEYFIINRSGQLMSKGYEEINEASDNLYVCKLKNNYGAINVKGEPIIPFMYSKLGDFKNGFAYYLSTKYGLVNTTNHALKAQWDWISDVDTNQIVIVKKENKFGLMRTNEAIILSPIFDYIAPCQNSIYLIVKNGKYGFYNLNELCFATALEYDYNPAYETNYYTNGKFFKLLRNNEVALIDANGRYSINFGTYSNLFFAKCDVIRIQKNNKYGYVDRKLKAITTVDFDQATDFENNVAIIIKSGKTQLINKEGKLLFTAKDTRIERIDIGLYQIKTNELLGLINENGTQLLPSNYMSIEKIHTHLYRCKKTDGGLYVFNTNTKLLKKL
jgi:hypothetical protein